MLTIAKSRTSSKGFTLIELVVVIALLALLFGLTVPSLAEWVRNARIRSTADSLQNAVRVAQAESLRRNRSIILFRTNAQPPAIGSVAAANGRNWSIQTIARFDDVAAELIESGTLVEPQSGIDVAGPTALCFNSNGRLVTNASATGPTGTGVPSGTCNAVDSWYDFTMPSATAARPLRLRVTLGGQVRMCDPARSITASPDGC
jgi:type IV fimbrial biogenesis protein FimT